MREYTGLSTFPFVVPSAPPTSVSVSEVTSSSITVQWGPVDCIHRNGNITGYSVQYGELGSAEGERTLQMVSNKQATISGLTPSTEYTISVAAINNAGIGIYSIEMVQQTTGEHRCCQPCTTSTVHTSHHFVQVVRSIYLFLLPHLLDALSVSVVSSSTTSLTISWTLADGLTANDYTISYSNTDTECFTTSYNDITTSQTMITLTGLEEGTDYSITVTVSLSDGGTGEDSLTATTMTAG